jgi:hypothetical protein
MEQLISYIKQNPDWEKKLSQKPYCLRIKKDENFPYYIFVYNMIDTDWSKDLCYAARGSILWIDSLHTEPICSPFYKFFNSQEGYAAKIDWDSSISREKIDGSLIKHFWSPLENKFRWATNGAINAKGSIPESALINKEMSFEDLIYMAMSKTIKRKILLENGKIIELSPNDLIKTKRGTIFVKDLQIDDDILEQLN